MRKEDASIRKKRKKEKKLYKMSVSRPLENHRNYNSIRLDCKMYYIIFVTTCQNLDFVDRL